MVCTEAKVLKVPYWKIPFPCMRADSAVRLGKMESPCAAASSVEVFAVWDHPPPSARLPASFCCFASGAHAGDECCEDLPMSHGHRRNTFQALWFRTAFLIRSS